jgi:ABC-type cobalt transport system substrate-binding protein
MDKKQIAAIVVAILAAIAGVVATWGGADSDAAETKVEEAAAVAAPEAKPAEAAPAAPAETPVAETPAVPSTEATPAPAPGK